MTTNDPQPYTDDELAELREWPAHRIVYEHGDFSLALLLDRLLATVDARTAERDALASELATCKDRAEEAALRSIEARNPGIDMDEVRRTRSAPVSGTPGEDTDGRPAEPICTTCRGLGWTTRRWQPEGGMPGVSQEVPCPDCRPVGDQPE